MEEDDDKSGEEASPSSDPAAHQDDLHDAVTLVSEMDLDARRIYGVEPLEHNQSDSLTTPQLDEEIGPDDSISVAWYKQHESAANAESSSQTDPDELPVTPVTIEGPDGSRHGMDAQLKGLTSVADLRKGMLQGYRDLLRVDVQPESLHVQARTQFGSSLLLTDEMPLNSEVLHAVSFYVWADHH